MLRRIWNHLSFSLRPFLVFFRNVFLILMVACTVLSVVDNLSKGARKEATNNLVYATESNWEGDKLDVNFSVKKGFTFREEQIKDLVKAIVGQHNTVVEDELIRGRRGYKMRNDIPLHLIRAFYTDGEAGKGPTVWLISENVTNIPEWLLKHEIDVPLN